MFSFCESLISLDLYNFNTLNSSIEYIFEGCNPNLIYCIDFNKSCSFLKKHHTYRNNCSEMCIRFNLKKYLPENNLCIDNCSTEVVYKYEYNNICYEKLPLYNYSYYFKNNINTSDVID